MTRQLTDINYYDQSTSPLSLLATHIYGYTTLKWYLASYSVYYQKFYFFQLSVFCVFSFSTSIRPHLSLSLSLSFSFSISVEVRQILSFTVSLKSCGYLIPVQEAGFNTKYERSVIFLLSQA